MVSSIVRTLSAVALLTVTASAARAQTTKPGEATATTAAAAWAALPTGTYELLIQLPERPLGATIVVRDSSGAPAATFQPEGDPAQPVRIAVKGSELTFNGEAPKGPFEIVLLRQGSDSLTGRWKYAGDEGKLTGKAPK